MTDDGLLGSAPCTIKVSDTAVILNGLDRPVILRPVGGRHQFMGPAYIYGIMYGAAVQRHEDAGGSDQIFELC